MVVQDKERLTCKIYEIKHSKEDVSEQYRHLTDTMNIQRFWSDVLAQRADEIREYFHVDAYVNWH